MENPSWRFGSWNLVFGSWNLARHRFVVLFCTLLGYFLLVPIVHQIHEDLHLKTPPLLEGILFVALLAGSVVSVSAHRAHLIIALGLGLPAALLGVAHGFVDLIWVEILRHLFGAAFIGYVIVVILLHVLSTRHVTFNTVCAALCVYLLLGLVWAVGYSLVDLFDPTAFRKMIPNGEPFSQVRFGKGQSTTALYFSFSTLTTVAYGDIVPMSPIARVLCNIEAITGQLYLVVLVARLVALNISESIEREKRTP